MCGILSFIGTPKTKKLPEFKALVTEVFNETEVRGRHASGYATTLANRKSKPVSYSKMPVASHLFTDHDRYYNSFWRYSPELFIGHCRYATAGSPANNKNNHPFHADEGNLWLVHNGTCKGLAYEKGLSKLCKTDCDSEMIIRLIERDGWEKGAKTLCNSDANFACLFIDRTDNTLKVIRNKERPLHYVDLRDRYGTMLFFSTPEIYKKALKTLKLKIDEPIATVGVNKLYTIDLDFNVTEKKFKVKKKKWWGNYPATKKSNKVTVYNGNYNSNKRYSWESKETDTFFDAMVVNGD